MKKSIYILASLIAVSCGVNPDETQNEAPLENNLKPVEIVNSEPENYYETIHASGRFKTDNEKVFSFKIGGIISEIYFDKGDKVKRGQVLASLNQSEIQAQIKQAEEALLKAERDLRRVRNLYADSVATLEQLENTETAFNIAREQKSIADFNGQHSLIRALEDGYILEKFSEKGQLVGPGSPVIQVGGASSENQDWILSVGVSDQEWSKLSIGDTAQVSSDIFGDVKLMGRVSRKSQSLNPRTSTFDIEITLSERPSSIAVGAFAEVEINSQQKLQLQKIPYSALVDAGKNQAFVFVLNEDSTARMIPISIHSFRQKTVLVEAGLEEFKQVIVSGSAYLKDGDAVEVHSKKS